MTATTTALGDEFARLKQGVEAATAGSRDGRLTATIDPTKTTKAKLEAVLKERGVLKK